VEVDLKFSIGEVFNLKIFALVFIVIVRWDEGIVGRRRGFVEALASEAPGFGIFFAAMWSC
jgi:hypothetical protein